MELIINLLQFSVTLLGFCLSGIRYLRHRTLSYFLLICFYGCFALGSLYWTLYLLLFSETPRIFYVSEFGWVSSVIFLYLLQYTLSSPEERSFSCRKSLLAPLIGVPLCAFYCTFGDILSNLLWCGMMILVSYRSIHGLVYAETQTGKGRKCLHYLCERGYILYRTGSFGTCAAGRIRTDYLRIAYIGILCYVAVEYALWTSGCFWPGDSIFSPYCWCDLLLTFCLFGLLPATGKAVRT